MDVLGNGGIRSSFRKLRQSQSQSQSQSQVSSGEEGDKAEQVGEQSCH